MLTTIIRTSFMMTVGTFAVIGVTLSFILWHASQSPYAAWFWLKLLRRIFGR